MDNLAGNTATKDAVGAYWNAAPCGTRDASSVPVSEFSKELERQRDEREPFIARFANFEQARGKKLLEVGVGAGTDHLRFARVGAICTGVDLTPSAIELTRSRLQSEGLNSNLQVSDAETLPFDDGTFDIVYSWGVIHHTPNTPKAATEIVRVLRPGGRFCVMIYNRHSLVALQTWLVYAAAKGNLTRSFSDVLASHMESPGTKAYTVGESRALFRGVEDLRVETVVTPYDMRIGRRRFLPRATHNLVPARFGWFHVLQGTRPAMRGEKSNSERDP